MKLTSKEVLFLALKLFINIAPVNLFYSLYRFHYLNVVFHLQEFIILDAVKRVTHAAS